MAVIWSVQFAQPGGIWVPVLSLRPVAMCELDLSAGILLALSNCWLGVCVSYFSVAVLKHHNQDNL